MKGQRPVLLAVVIAVAVTALFYLFLLRPKFNQISAVREQIVQAEQEEQDLLQDIARLEQVQQDAPQTRARLARVSDLLPSTPELPGFIRLVQGAANAEGIDLKSIAPSPPSPVDDQLEMITVSLLVEGSFFQTEAFLARLENLKRLVEVTSIAISPTEGETGATLSTTLSLTMYVYREPA